MSDEQIFEQAFKDAIFKTLMQGKKSVSDYGECMYRSSVGCCPVGHMIKDEFYHPILEGGDATSTNVIDAINQSLEITIDETQKTTLENLQMCHDYVQYDFIDQFITKIEYDVRGERLPEYCLEPIEQFKQHEIKEGVVDE